MLDCLLPFCEKYLCNFDRDYMTYQPPKIVLSTLALDFFFFLVTFVVPLSCFCFLFSKTAPMCLWLVSGEFFYRFLTRLWRRQWQPTPVLLPGKSHGWRSLVRCSPWGHEESDTTERLHFHFSLSCVGEGNGNPLQCSCLENPRDGSLVGCRPWGRTESDTTEVT